MKSWFRKWSQGAKRIEKFIELVRHNIKERLIRHHRFSILKIKITGLIIDRMTSLFIGSQLKNENPKVDLLSNRT